MMKKLHSILSLVTYVVLIAHNTLAALLMCGIMPYSPAVKNSGFALAGCFCAHAVISIIIIALNKSDSGRFYPVKDKQTAVQRISAIPLIVLFVFHLTAYKNFADPSALTFIPEILFLICAVLHSEISIKKTFSSLGIGCKPLLWILRILLLASAIFTAVGLVMFFLI